MVTSFPIHSTRIFNISSAVIHMQHMLMTLILQIILGFPGKWTIVAFSISWLSGKDERAADHWYYTSILSLFYAFKYLYTSNYSSPVPGILESHLWCKLHSSTQLLFLPRDCKILNCHLQIGIQMIKLLINHCSLCKVLNIPTFIEFCILEKNLIPHILVHARP